MALWASYRGVATLQPTTLTLDENGDMDDRATSTYLTDLANNIAHDLDFPTPNETIQLCGLAPLRIIASRPDEVLQLATEKINATPYEQVPKCWRRLLEDASLRKAVRMLRAHAEALSSDRRLELKPAGMNLHAQDAKWLDDIVGVIETGLIVSGGPGRNDLIYAIYRQLDDIVNTFDARARDYCVPATFMIVPPPELRSQQLIARARGPAVSMEDFQTYLHTSGKPLIIPDVTRHWPAADQWQNPQYLLDVTLGGRRRVPVEIGSSYIDQDWSQEVMSIKQYITECLLPANPDKIGYLAQHDLFQQIPNLKADIITPDYVYTTPPAPGGAALRTAGLHKVAQLDEPLVNAWLGPKGTKTPLHTDPYHNVLCQVVGYKYVRLYSPEETARLYPLGVNDQGIHMDNTSRIDIAHVREPSLGASTGSNAEDVYRQYPSFRDAKFVESILAPGECLYVPLGWWHYVESLSTSFSVSFWWN